MTEISKKQAVILCFSTLTSLAGRMFSKWQYPMQLNTPGTKTLSSANDLLTNVGKSLVGILEMLGGITSIDHPTIFSEQGITTLLGFVVASALFISACSTIRKALRIYVSDKSASIQYSMMMLWMFGVNAFCLSYANLTYGSSTFEYRYWILPIVPMLLLIGLYLANLEQRNKTLSRILFLFIIVVSTIFSAQTIESCCQVNNSADHLEEMLLTISTENNIETLYVVDDAIGGRIMRLLTSDFEVVSVNADLSLHGWGAKISGYDTTKIGILAQNHVIEKNPVLKTACTLRQSFEYGQYNFYACNPGIFDFRAGLPDAEENEGWDSPTTQGYCIASELGKINDSGELESYGNTAGCLLFGPYTASIPGRYDIALHYVIDDYIDGTAGTFDVALDMQSWSSIPFDGETTSVTLESVEIDAGHTFEARVWVPEGMHLRVQSIEYRRVS